jgi:hypothetical protein
LEEEQIAMELQSSFPRTETVDYNCNDERVNEISVYQSVKIHNPSHAAFSRKVEIQRKRIGGLGIIYGREGCQQSYVIKQVNTFPNEKPWGRRYTQVSMPGVKPSDSQEKTAVPSPPFIPKTSPIYDLQFLEIGWDGYWAEPLSKKLLIEAHQLWENIERISSIQSMLPVVKPSANGAVAFTWSLEYPVKELEIWLYDQQRYHAEWLLSFNDKDRENVAQSQEELLELITTYQEL